MVAGISVVIPNYNGISLFTHTLSTVKEALQNSGKPHEIIIVDDCSTDGSVTFLQQQHPDIKVMENDTNSGFSVTANKGIFAATYDKVLLLNSDVQLTPQYFASQLKYFDKPDTFGVMGRITGWDDDIIQDGAKLPSFHGVKIKTSGNYLLKEEALMKNGLYSMYLSGANAFVDKNKFIHAGGLNELFSPFYVEDFELSLRAWRLGYSCYYDYSSICKHRVSTTIKSKSRKKYVDAIYDRNKMFLHALHLQGAKKLLWFLQLIPETLIRFVTFRWHYFTSLFLFFRSLKKINQSIKQFEQVAAVSARKRSVAEVASFILGNIKGEKIVF